ncbi:MAG: ArsR family transcriptional regulator [Anaerolineae bacterium]|nr:ArsR family transcriptional regulator [Anaerolineae bacterium]
MQQTRKHILEILKEQKEATIDEIVTSLTDRIGKITAVTVRHHLEILRGDGLVAAPAVRRRSAPGRPQYVYTLTDRAADYFPNNYQGLATGLIDQIKEQLPSDKVGDILSGVAEQMAAEAMIPDAPIHIRLDHAVAYLNKNGYSAAWHVNGNGRHILTISNCPYEQVSSVNPELCKMDRRLIEGLINVPVTRTTCQLEDEYEACTYVINIT